MPTPRELILRLNSLSIGDLELLRTKLDAARHDLGELGQEELAGRMDDAIRHLAAGEMADYRRVVNQVVSRLGHVARKARQG